jgi:signal transduction histidine kinase
MLEVGYALLDREGQVLTLNRAGRAMCAVAEDLPCTGLRARGTLGSGADWGWIPSAVADLGVPTTFISMIPDRTSTRFVRFHLRPFAGPSSSGTLVAATFSDATEEIEVLRQQAAALVSSATAHERLTQFLGLQEDLLFSLAHDLKTPPVVIQGFAELLLRGRYGPLSAEQEKPVQTVYRNVLNLSEMVDQLLDFSRLLRRIRGAPSPIPLARAWGDATDGFGRSGYLLATFSPCQVEGDDTVVVERTALSYTLRNLVTNSLRLARPGTEIHPAVRRRGPAVELSIDVTVLLEEHPSLPRLLDGMFQSTSAALNDAGLGGPGLAAGRYLATLMGGGLTAAEPSEDAGRLVLTLPAGV